MKIGFELSEKAVAQFRIPYRSTINALLRSADLHITIGDSVFVIYFTGHSRSFRYRA